MVWVSDGFSIFSEMLRWLLIKCSSAGLPFLFEHCPPASPYLLLPQTAETDNRSRQQTVARTEAPTHRRMINVVLGSNGPCVAEASDEDG